MSFHSNVLAAWSRRVVMLGALAVAAQADVSVLYAPSEADQMTFRSELAVLVGGPIDYLDARVFTPTVSQLLDYDCVMTWVNYPYDDAELMGDRLADFVDAGGKVILGSGCYGDSGNHLAGRIMTAEYCPAIIGCCGGAYAGDGADCVHAGVTTYVAYDVVVELQPGAESDGTVGSEGKSAVAWRADRLVYYSCGNTGATFGGGDWAQLTANMCTCPVEASDTGDLNCDGVLNAFDIDPFVLALADEEAYYAAFPDCDRMHADINCDGTVDAFDIDAFVGCIGEAGCDCP